MPKDDQAARDSKAQKLREQISRLKDQDKAGAHKESSSAEDPRPKSPRDFVNERMREKDEEEQSDDA
jgi:hypothetical protein